MNEQPYGDGYPNSTSSRPIPGVGPLRPPQYPNSPRDVIADLKSAFQSLIPNFGGRNGNSLMSTTTRTSSATVPYDEVAVAMRLPDPPAKSQPSPLLSQEAPAQEPSNFRMSLSLPSLASFSAATRYRGKNAGFSRSQPADEGAEIW